MIAWIVLLSVALGGGTPRTVTEDEIKQAVEQFVRAKIGNAHQEVRIEFRSVPNKIANIPHDAQLHIVDDNVPTLQDVVILPVEIVTNDRVLHTFLVSLRVRTFDPVIVANETIGNRQQAEVIPVTIEQRETTALPADRLTTREQLQGKRTKQIVRRGAVLRQSMFEEMPLVQQGSVVTLVVKTGQVLVRTAAIAREDGTSGALVRVQRLGSNELFSARVVDERTVELANDK
ncbi:MAG: flagella basal body P-ring formation protein FlgA [Ignavibacteria bacterium]